MSKYIELEPHDVFQTDRFSQLRISVVPRGVREKAPRLCAYNINWLDKAQDARIGSNGESYDVHLLLEDNLAAYGKHDMHYYNVDPEVVSVKLEPSQGRKVFIYARNTSFDPSLAGPRDQTDLAKWRVDDRIEEICVMPLNEAARQLTGVEPYFLPAYV